ncbi:hypothetical protein RMATCC62417_06521 [Rhizopus microsporus]|nr:hypothetical protein RMATCC62417_06521 [Rhizopus microsporus]
MKRVCPICQTTKFRRSGDTGLVCKYGHKVLGVQREEAEDDFYGGGGRTRKRIKVVEEAKDLTATQVASYEYLIIQFALQVITRSMVEYLDFSPEIEATVREFWLLYISKSQFEIEGAYEIEDNERREQEKNKSNLSDFGLSTEETHTLEALDIFDDTDDDDDDHSEAKDGNDSCANPIFRQPRSWPRARYTDVIAFIYLACIHLRYPILLNDLILMCKTGRLPYLHMQKLVPDDLLSSLSLHVTEKMTYVPTLDRLRNRVYKYARCFFIHCNLELPDVNIPLYLDRFCSYYFLPVEGYYHALFLFQKYREKHLQTLSISRRSCHNKIDFTTLLIASVIATAKLMYSIDGSKKDLDKASEFDIYTSKQAWLRKIRNNIKLWQARLDKLDTMNLIIEKLKERSRAYSLSVRDSDKPAMILGLLKNHGHHYFDWDSKKTDPFMDPLKHIYRSNDTEEKELLKLGSFYYRKAKRIRVSDYSDLIKLACLITGEPLPASIETALKRMDRIVLQSNFHERITNEEYRSRRIST